MAGIRFFSGRAMIAVVFVTMLVAMAVSPAVRPALAGNTPSVAVNFIPVVASIAANVSAQRIYHLLYDLQNFSTRYVATPNINASADYIVSDYSNTSNLIISSQYFNWNGYTLRNILAVLPAFNPANKTVYVVGGHYDSWVQAPGNPMVWAPGVDDDGSGTVAAMEIARVLAPYRFNATLLFAAWTAEEVGLVGSDYHAASLRAAGQEVGATLGLDMIGNYAGTMGLELVHDGISEWIADALVQANIDYGVGLQLTKNLNLAANSDHASFWAHGYPAIMEAEADFSPNWHQTTDTIDNVNLTLITKATQMSAAALAELAGIIPPGFGSVTLDKRAYKPGDQVNVTLYDSDLNVNPGSPDPATVTIKSDTEPVGETVILTETGANTSIFKGGIQVITGPPTGGALEVSNGDVINATYIDADPPGIRHDQAIVDSVLPIISGVYAIPDLDYATVYWQTNEPTDSKVLYGDTVALGNSTSVAGLTLGHSVLLSDLKPGTKYFYDVLSADEAGNLAIDDNGGAHYTFVTLTGFIVRPKFGYIGYVKSNDPTGNYFTSPEVIVGQGVQGTYLGAAQFNTSAVSIPPTATIIKATLEMLGREWIYDDLGQWNLRLLNDSIDPGWTTHGYTTINAAVSDATIPPTMTHPDLLPGKWNSFVFQPSQYDQLRNRVNTGTISFRVDGPRSSRIIFSWNSGNDFPILAPKLRVAYSLTGDTMGPLVTQLTATPNPTMAAPSSTISVTVSDLTTGAGNVALAEYYWGSDPGLGLATPLVPDDGGFDSPTETSTFNIDVSSMPRGAYALGFRGKDQSDNWGPTRVLTLYVGVWDLYPPMLGQLAFAPPVAESGTPVNMSLRITDDIAVYGAHARVTNPIGILMGNFTMSYDTTSGNYYYVTPTNLLGTYDVIVWANDTSGRWNGTTGSFQVEDATHPVIVQISADPPVQNYGSTVTFTAWVTDKFLDSVHVAVWDPIGVFFGNFTASYEGPPGENYSYMLSFPTLGLWGYCFSAVDTSGNWATACGNFTIVDGYPPTFISLAATPPVQSYGQSVTITARVVDQFVSSVYVDIVGPGAVPVGNFSMTRVTPWGDNWTYAQVYDPIGFYSFTAWAFDSSSNSASSSGSFTIADLTPPVFGNVVINPNPAPVSATVAVTVEVTDVQSVTVNMEVRNPSGGVVSNSTMAFNAGAGNYASSLQVVTVGNYRLIFWAVDASFNKARLERTFAVIDPVAPEVTVLDIQALLAETYNDINITVRITDNYALQSGAATIEWRDPSNALLVNVTLLPIGLPDYSNSLRLVVGGQNHYTIMAVDTSGNRKVVTGSFNVVLGQAPVAVAGTDKNITTGSSLTFNGSASLDDFGIAGYSWHIVGPDVNETRQGQEINFTFAAAGTYTVTLTVVDGTGRQSSDSLTVTVTALTPPAEHPLDAVMVLFALFVIVFVVALAILILARRKKVESEEEGQPAVEEKEETKEETGEEEKED